MRQCFTFTVLVFTAISSPLMASNPVLKGPVGQWGDPSRIRIEGARQLDSQEIRKGLAGNFQHFLASHPSAPLAGFPESVERRLLRGYQHAGFGEARIDVRLDLDAQQVVVRIDEGQRRRAGAIRVEAPPKILKPLTQLLSARRPPDGATPAELSDHGGVVAWKNADGKQVDEDKPLWIPNLPAQLDETAAEARRKRVEQSLADLGFDQAEFTSAVRMDGALAEWHVRVSDLGSPATLHSIEIAGNRNNSREQILDYLNLRTGTTVTRELRRRIERSLWNSARFVASNVEVRRIPDAPGVRMTIEVQEYPHAPNLPAPFSREEAALLKHRYWMIHGAGRQMDFVATANRPHCRIEVILSPVEGISSCVWNSAEANGLPDFAVVASDQDLAAFAVGLRRKFAAPVQGVQLNATLSMGLNEQDPDNPFKIGFGFGFETLDDGEVRTPLTLTTSMPPVYFLGLAHESTATSWEGNVLTIRSKRGSMRIDERTGEMIDLTASPSEEDGTTFGFAFERQAFARRRQQLLAATAEASNEFDRTRPISSVAGFMLNTGMVSSLGGLLYGQSFSEQAPQASLAACGKLVDHGLLAIADNVVTVALADDGEDFRIPAQLNHDHEFQLRQFYGFLVAQAADQIFPRDSWAWTMWRESALVVAGLSQHAGSELNKLMADPRCGPTSYWLLAELMNAIRQPVGPIAGWGLSKFNREAFIREWETALGSELQPSIAMTLASLQSLTDDDIAALMVLVTDPQSEWVRIAGQLRAASPPGPQRTTADLLADIWSTDLRGRLEQRLRQLAELPRVADKPGKVER